MPSRAKRAAIIRATSELGMYTSVMTDPQFLIAKYAEIEIEGRAWELTLRTHDRYRTSELEAHRSALKLIDEHKALGTYESYRNELSGLLEKEHPELFRPIGKEYENRIQLVENLYAGLDSPNQKQRERFQAFSDEIGLGEKAPWEIMCTLAVLEKAEKRRGRLALIPPWRNAIDELNEIKDACAKGIPLPTAALTVARQQESAGPENRAKLLVDYYRQRAALRE
jgi:hypothetical protein